MTRNEFNDWLALQPDDRQFNYSDTRRCLLASFLNETNRNPSYEFSCGSLSYTKNFLEPDGSPAPKLRESIEVPGWMRDLLAAVTPGGEPFFSIADVRREYNLLPL